jgi:hypothetical protein
MTIKPGASAKRRRQRSGVPEYNGVVGVEAPAHLTL